MVKQEEAWCYKNYVTQGTVNCVQQGKFLSHMLWDREHGHGDGWGLQASQSFLDLRSPFER